MTGGVRYLAATGRPETSTASASTTTGFLSCGGWTDTLRRWLLMPPRTAGAYAKAKGVAAEQAVARYLQSNGYPMACTARSESGGMQFGEDILGVPGVALEVKNRRDIQLGASLKQAAIQGGPNKIAVVIIKPVGVGLDSVGDWWALSYVRHQVPLWPKDGQL